jgi:hypothetical protein
VTCLSAARCTAVGTSHGLVENWNGTRWTRQSVPRPAGTMWPYGLNAVSCTGASTCEAVGSIQTKWSERYVVPLAAGE